MAVNDSIAQEQEQQHLTEQQQQPTSAPELPHITSTSDFTVGLSGESSDSDNESYGPITATDGSDVDELTEEEEESGSFDQPVQVDAKHKVVLVTGGAGFVGSHVADALLARGDSVIIVDELNDYYDVNLKRANLDMLVAKYGEARLKIVEGDIADMHLMDKLFRVHQPRHVVHMAARAGVRPSIENPFVYIHSNILGTTNLLELARTYGNDCFVWASSSSVYGGSLNEEFSESDIVDKPVSQYAATKKACELITYTYHSLYNLNVTGLRFFTVYGPRGRPDMAPFKFVDRISRGLEIQQFGDGSSSRDYTYIDDIVDGIVRSLDRPMGYQIFNLGNGSPYKLTDFIGLVEKYVGKKAIVRVLPDQPGDVPRTCANIDLARELLGYEPKVPFEEGIKRTVEWYQKWQTRDMTQQAKAAEEKRCMLRNCSVLSLGV